MKVGFNWVSTERGQVRLVLKHLGVADYLYFGIRGVEPARDLTGRQDEDLPNEGCMLFNGAERMAELVVVCVLTRANSLAGELLPERVLPDWVATIHPGVHNVDVWSSQSGSLPN